MHPVPVEFETDERHHREASGLMMRRGTTTFAVSVKIYDQIGCGSSHGLHSVLLLYHFSELFPETSEKGTENSLAHRGVTPRDHRVVQRPRAGLGNPCNWWVAKT